MDQSQELRRVGLKVTHPRVRILAILQSGHPRHLTAEDVYRQLVDSDEDVGLATVYRVLTQFESAGIVSKHHFESGQAVFELNRGRHHDHMIDLDTGKVIEFVDDEIERLQRAIAERHGYDLEDHSLVLYVRAGKKAGRMQDKSKADHAAAPLGALPAKAVKVAGKSKASRVSAADRPVKRQPAVRTKK